MTSDDCEDGAAPSCDALHGIEQKELPHSEVLQTTFRGGMPADTCAPVGQTATFDISAQNTAQDKAQDILWAEFRRRRREDRLRRQRAETSDVQRILNEVQHLRTPTEGHVSSTLPMITEAAAAASSAILVDSTAERTQVQQMLADIRDARNKVQHDATTDKELRPRELTEPKNQSQPDVRSSRSKPATNGSRSSPVPLIRDLHSSVVMKRSGHEALGALTLSSRSGTSQSSRSQNLKPEREAVVDGEKAGAEKQKHEVRQASNNASKRPQKVFVRVASDSSLVHKQAEMHNGGSEKPQAKSPQRQQSPKWQQESRKLETNMSYEQENSRKSPSVASRHMSKSASQPPAHVLHNQCPRKKPPEEFCEVFQNRGNFQQRFVAGLRTYGPPPDSHSSRNFQTCDKAKGMPYPAGGWDDRTSCPVTFDKLGLRKTHLGQASRRDADGSLSSSRDVFNHLSRWDDRTACPADFNSFQSELASKKSTSQLHAGQDTSI